MSEARLRSCSTGRARLRTSFLISEARFRTGTAQQTSCGGADLIRDTGRARLRDTGRARLKSARMAGRGRAWEGGGWSLGDVMEVT